MTEDNVGDIIIDKAIAFSNQTDMLPTTQQHTKMIVPDIPLKGLTVRDQSQELSESGTIKVGISIKNLTIYKPVSGSKKKTVASYVLSLIEYTSELYGRRRPKTVEIIRNVQGLLCSGEIILVVGKPGSGCTSFLRALAGQHEHLLVDPSSELNYQGIPRDKFWSEFRGECNYHSEIDVHFPTLTVAQTFIVAARARVAASSKPTSRNEAATSHVLSTAAGLGISHTLDTIVGNDFVKGVSGGERHRTSIGEALLCHASIQCWGNLTRGLDSSSALNLVKVLQDSARTTGALHIVTINQASQDIYNLFDKVVLLDEGNVVFWGSTNAAEKYFSNLGFVCPERCPTSDFLASITNPNQRTRFLSSEAKTRPPRTAKEFTSVWLNSSEYAALVKEVDLYNAKFPLRRPNLETARATRMNSRKSGMRAKSPYSISFLRQVYICITRGFQRLSNNLAPPISALLGNAVVSIILGSVFYNMPMDTSSFFSRGTLIFFTIMTNTFLGAFEGGQLWEQRPIVRKHFQYAMYHPSAEAIASMICEVPNKILLTTSFNLPVYFLSNMRKTPGAFLTFYTFAFATLVAGSMLFRLIATCSKTLTLSVAPGAGFVLLLVIYTGFVIPIQDMRPWLRWFAYLDPVGYAFESLMINEFSGRKFSCVGFVPDGDSYAEIGSSMRTCTVPGHSEGSLEVDGDAYLRIKFQFHKHRLWSNLGVILSLTVLLCVLYLLSAEFIATRDSRNGGTERQQDQKVNEISSVGEDEETLYPEDIRERFENEQSKHQARVLTAGPAFFWNNVNYVLERKKGGRKILHDIEGWIKPGTLTALMGASGAGKTSLLNVLAGRTTTGIITGDFAIDMRYRNQGFARNFGYAQQQDLHLPTTSVREALVFSARLRQPETYSDQEKLNWVDQLIHTLDMATFSEELIGASGAGLSAEQRKRVTIGVELAARPELLLFLDEPTSGLDNNTAWSICKLLKRLADEGQQILCTIHQPSESLFRIFDRLLLLHEGRSVYFGDIGPSMQTVIDYFQHSGARHCEGYENPAEWLLEVISSPDSSWADLWSYSKERDIVKREIEQLKTQRSGSQGLRVSPEDPLKEPEFATKFWYQLRIVTKRTLELDWRTQSYLYSKVLMTLGAGFLNGFSFYHSPNTIQGVQNQIFSVFLLLTLHSNAVQLLMPHFIESRDLFEIRERQSGTYSWPVFVLSNIIAELPWQAFLSVILFVSWYFPLGLYETALSTGQVHERSTLTLLIIWSYLTFSSTFTHMIGTIMPDASTGINISALLYTLSLINCGVLVPPASLPKIWNLIYQITPVNYFANSLLSTGISGITIECAKNEIVLLNPPTGKSCESYLYEYLKLAGGNLLNPQAYSQCEYCPVSDTSSLLGNIGVHFDKRWRNFGITLVFSVINVLGALSLYWLFRVPKKSKS